jgi:hypothetical protein
MNLTHYFSHKFYKKETEGHMSSANPCENRPGFPWISLDYLEKILQLIPG